MSEWLTLAQEVQACTRCAELAAARQHVVVGDNPSGARVLLVGEAPGADEDASGRPFVGRAGKALDAALETAGLPREQVAVLNIIKCRPPGNRPSALRRDRKLPRMAGSPARPDRPRRDRGARADGDRRPVGRCDRLAERASAEARAAGPAGAGADVGRPPDDRDLPPLGGAASRSERCADAGPAGGSGLARELGGGR